MGEARRLVTSIEVDEAGLAQATGDNISISALHELELRSGERVILLADRGWTTSGPSRSWSSATLERLMDTARMVVGPDEPPPGRSSAEEAALHWAQLSVVARAQEMHVTPDELASLPHDVHVGPGIQARILA